MTIKEIADRLVELCRKGDFATVQSELFADDVVSIEQHATPDFQKETKGKQAIKEKGEKWGSMVEQIHAMEISDAVVAANSFACSLRMHVTMKERGEMNMTELCVYTVKDGKITSEQFFMQKD